MNMKNFSGFILISIFILTLSLSAVNGAESSTAIALEKSDNSTIINAPNIAINKNEFTQENNCSTKSHITSNNKSSTLNTGTTKSSTSIKSIISNYAILVGVADYQQINDLDYSVNDANDMKTVCSTVMGIPSTNISTLLNSQATKHNITSLIQGMATKMSSNDKLLFFFSGHGSNGPDLSPYDESNDVYICPYDTTSDPTSKISDDELHDWFKLIPSQNILCIFDSCFSGGMATNGSSITDNDLNKYTVLMASSETQYSWETDELQNGVFTYYLTYAFNHANSIDIDLNRNKIVSAEEAFAYAKIQAAYLEKSQMHDPSINQFEITPPDLTAPQITSTDPANNANHVNPGKDLVVTFSENILQGSNFNNITLTNSSNNPVDISLNISNNILTISPTNNLTTGTYTLHIPLNAITDQAENTLTSAYTTMFTVDNTPPQINYVSPADNAVNVSPSKDIVVTFTESILQSSNFYNITLTCNNTPLDINLNLSNNILTISPTNNLTTGTYTLHIPLNAITDQAENTLTSAFTSTFTVDATSPQLSTSIPGGIYKNNKIVTLLINETGNIYYTTNGSNPTTSSKKYSSPLVISCNLVLKYFAVDLAGNKSIIYTEKYTIDRIAPQITYTIPSHQSTGYSKTASIYIKFSENILASTYWNLIKLKNLTTNSYVSITKSISRNVLIIRSTIKRVRFNWYTINIPASAVKDIAGNRLTLKYVIRFKTES